MKIKDLMALKVGDSFISTGEGSNNPVLVIILNIDKEEEKIAYLWSHNTEWPIIKVTSFSKMADVYMNKDSLKVKDESHRKRVEKFRTMMWEWVKHEFTREADA